MSKWTSDQLRAIEESGKNIIVSAGAGSGKTAVLTERVIEKLVNGQDINRLLILTFTREAAGEMRARIRKSIKSKNLKEALEGLSSSYITTFDSFALSVVKRYHTQLNVSKNVSIMDSALEESITNKIMDEVFESSYGDKIFDKLIMDFCSKSDENMKDIVKGMSKRLDLLIDKNAFLDSYVDSNFNDLKISKDINTYMNSIYNLIGVINEDYREMSKYVDSKYIETFNIEPLLKSKTYIDVKNNLNLGSPRKNKNCSDEFKPFKDRINENIKILKNLCRFQNEEEIRSTIYKTKDYIEAIINIIIKVDREFLKYKKDNDLYTFNDIAKMAIFLLKENSIVREELKSSFDEIMIDEYQDTSSLQEEFINLISNNNVYMVGDIKQSIYRFRNANPYIFRDKYNKYSNNDNGIKIDLLKNFRSRPEVLDNINLIFSLIMDKYVGDADYITSHQMNFGNISYIEECSKEQNSNMEILEYEESDEYSNEEIEIFTIAHDIKNKLDSGYKIVDKDTKVLRPCRYSDFAIIMDRGTSFDKYKKIFEYVGIPLTQIKNEKLTLGNDILIIKNLVKLIIKVNNNELDTEFKYLFTSISRSYIMNTPDSLIFDLLTNGKIKMSELYKKCASIDIDSLSCLDLINLIIKEFDIISKLNTTTDIKSSIIKIDYLRNLCVSLSDLGYTPILFAQFLEEMTQKEKIEYSLSEDESESVKILNIHKSKGLEYSVCYFSGLYKKNNTEDIKSKFLVDFNNNIIVPYIDDGVKNTIYKDLFLDIETKNNISEKIRLFYVALTRAREKIIILLPYKEKEGYTSLVPAYDRLNYKSIADMLYSIYPVLKKYIIDINLDDIGITRDYEKIKKYNLDESLNKVDIKINEYFNDIKYEKINNKKYSKENIKLLTYKEYLSKERGKEIHYMFEVEDFKNTKCKYVLNFLKHIDLNYINCYKEYEFVYSEDSIQRHGIIDLILEYEDHIDIIDYKLQNTLDEAYINQLRGYKTYLNSFDKRPINTYLYSINDDRLDCIKI